ncbi:MAG: HD domain-containing protein [Planctomycetes bacterium]|nr:HD domain-containing protein [Planctomycetota bacterium]
MKHAPPFLGVPALASEPDTPRLASSVALFPDRPPHGRDELLRALVDALDLREHETAGHSHRVAAWTLLFAAVCDVPMAQRAAVYAGALLHDVGKIAIPDPILLKRGRLDRREWAVMRTHPDAGRRLLARTLSLRGVTAIPWAHHERWDGSGYPRGLKKRRIPLAARLFAIVDVYDALRSRRPYKEPVSHHKSIAMLRSGAAGHFDPQLVARFVALPVAMLRRLAPRRGTRPGYPHIVAAVNRALAWLRLHAPEALTAHGGGPKLPVASSSPRARVRLRPRTRSSRPRAGS